MILYVNGDSNSSGAELEDISNAWPNYLSKKLSWTLVNHAASGCSNDRIYRTTTDYINSLTNYDNLYIIIGWTSWEREEWLVDGEYYQVNASGMNYFPTADLRERYKNWMANYDPDITTVRGNHKWHGKIWDLHQTLSSKGIPHLFFNATMCLKDNNIKDWGNNYIHPYDNNYAYQWFLKNHGFRWTDGYHHREDAQKFWGDYLYDTIC